jgi:hypothetical protein
MMPHRRDNGDGNDETGAGVGVSAGAQTSRAGTANADEYRAKLGELDHAWATLTDFERRDLEAETKRRRDANPNWPFLNSDHADRMIARIKENTTAVHALEDAIGGADGMVLRMRASTSAIDLMRDQLERHAEALNGNTIAQDALRTSIDRLIASLGAGTAST